MDKVDRAGFDFVVERLAIKAAQAFKREHEVDLRQDALASARLRQEVIRMAEENKRVLIIPFITATSDGPKHMEISFSGSDVRQVRKYLK